MASFLDNLELFSMGASWGAFESLIIPADAAATRSAARWQSSDQLFRVHAGMENIDDLIADLDAGLERYRSDT